MFWLFSCNGRIFPAFQKISDFNLLHGFARLNDGVDLQECECMPPYAISKNDRFVGGLNDRPADFFQIL